MAAMMNLLAQRLKTITVFGARLDGSDHHGGEITMRGVWREVERYRGREVERWRELRSQYGEYGVNEAGADRGLEDMCASSWVCAV